MSETTRDPNPSHEAIARRAYEIYLSRGRDNHGHDLDDWLQAESELRGPITTAAEEAAVRGAEAEAAEEKRRSDVGGDLPMPARALMTNVGPSITPEQKPRQE